jgi:hypothetical protein
LRLHKAQDFKQDYLDKHWDKVCHYHYFSDLYQYKKSLAGGQSSGAGRTLTKSQKKLTKKAKRETAEQQQTPGQPSQSQQPSETGKKKRATARGSGMYIDTQDLPPEAQLQQLMQQQQQMQQQHLTTGGSPTTTNYASQLMRFKSGGFFPIGNGSGLGGGGVKILPVQQGTLVATPKKEEEFEVANDMLFLTAEEQQLINNAINKNINSSEVNSAVNSGENTGVNTSNNNSTAGTDAPVVEQEQQLNKQESLMPL